METHCVIKFDNFLRSLLFYTMDCAFSAYLRKNPRGFAVFILSLCCLLSANFFFFTEFFVHAETASDTQSPKLERASVSLKDDIVLHYYISLPDGVTSPSLTFSIDGSDAGVSSFSQEENGLYKFSFSGITPQLIFSTVSSILNYTENGETKTLALPDYSVSEYCENLLLIDLYEGLSPKKLYALKAVAVDILKYGKAASALVNGEETARLSLSPEVLALSNERNGNDDILPTKTVEATSDKSVIWTAAGVSFSSCVSVYFKAKVKTADIPSLKFSIRYDKNGEFVQSKSFSETKVDEEYSTVKFYSDGISPKFFTAPLQAQIFIAGTGDKYGGYCEYSVSSCVYTNINDGKYSDFVKAVFAYGKSAVLYENIDSLDFTTTGSVENDDYALTATKDNYNYRIACPSVYSDSYKTEMSADGTHKLVLNSGYVYDCFGAIETEIPTYIKIGNKLFTTDFTSLPENITATNDNGVLAITLNNYNSSVPLSVCAPNGVEITLNGDNHICYETVQKSVYSPVNATFSGSGNLYSGVVETAELTINNSSLNISTGNATGNGYALKTTLSSYGNIDITTNLDYGFEMTGDSNIQNGNLTIDGANIGIKGNGALQFFGSETQIDIQAVDVGIDIANKLNISSGATLTISAKSTGIKAKTFTANGNVTITDTANSAIVLSATTDNIALKKGSLKIIGKNTGIAAIDMTFFSGNLSITSNMSISITGYKYGFSTTANATYAYGTESPCTLNKENMTDIPHLAFKGFSN